MKKTLKRELKLFEIVESDAFVVSVCFVFGFFFCFPFVRFISREGAMG